MTDQVERLKTSLCDRYGIERELGAGGMATVYLAHDLKHDRKVAIKVLRPELAAVLGADRFVQEIKTTANLQHPNILPLFDSGEADRFLYYVMPYVDGETLRDKLNREKQLGIEEAVRITTEVAEALDYAHRQDVVHRDIKPENILLHDGRPLVADFGIALAVSAAAGGRMTETGLSLGTPHYMSPEQATAEKDLSNRSDIYSLGAVLYEMLTGDPPHTGSTAQQIIMKIVTDEPRPVVELRKTTPPNVAMATERALAKLPADRFASARDFVDALTRPITAITQTHSLRGPVGSRTWRMAVPWSIAGIALIGATVTWLAGRDRSAPPSRRLSIMLPESAQVALGPVHPMSGSQPILAPTPDGASLIYTGFDGTHLQLFRRPLNGYESDPLPGTLDGLAPFISPDGAWLGFFAESRLQRLALRGGDPISIAAAPNPMGGVWTEDGEIIYTEYEATRLSSVPAGGGGPRVLSDTTLSEPWFYISPELLPGGEVVLVQGRDPPAVVAVHLATGEHKVITAGASPQYLSTGHLVFARGTTLYAARFDPEALELRGEAIRCEE